MAPKDLDTYCISYFVRMSFHNAISGRIISLNQLGLLGWVRKSGSHGHLGRLQHEWPKATCIFILALRVSLAFLMGEDRI